MKGIKNMFYFGSFLQGSTKEGNLKFELITHRDGRKWLVELELVLHNYYFSAHAHLTTIGTSGNFLQGASKMYE